MIIPESFFTVINIGIVAIYLLVVFRAYKSGLLYEALNFVGTIASFLISWILSPILAEHFPIVSAGQSAQLGEELVAVILSPVINALIWFVIVLLVVKILISIILPIFKIASKVPVLGAFNRIGGALFGILNATIAVLILSMVLSIPLFQNGQEVKEKTWIKPVSDLSNQVLVYVAEHIDIKGLEDSLEQELGGIDGAREALEGWMKEQGILK